MKLKDLIETCKDNFISIMKLKENGEGQPIFWGVANNAKLLKGFQNMTVVQIEAEDNGLDIWIKE